MRRQQRYLALCLLGLAALALVLIQQSTKSQAVMPTAPPNLFGEAQPRPPVSPPGAAQFTLSYRRGADIRDRIDPNASAVTILQKGAEGLVVAPPDDMSVEEFMTREHDAVALVKIVRKDGYLTPAADWIKSTVTAQVLDVLKPDPRGSLAPDKLIAFPEHGGDVQIGATHVSAVRMWAEPLQTGAIYLVFFQQDKEGRLSASEGSIVRIEQDRVYGLTEYTKRALQEHSSSALIDAVRANSLFPRVHPRY